LIIYRSECTLSTGSTGTKRRWPATGVSPEEAEHVVNHARRPFPEEHGEKLFVAGPTAGGRWLQVIFVLDDSETAFVIHARPLNEAERKRFRKRIG
jgi:hypothetical protein